MTKAIWITWQHHRRTESLCDSLGIRCICHTYKGHRVLRYLTGIISFYRAVKVHRPSVLFVQNPSFVLALTAICFRPFFNFKLVVDAHNEAIMPFNSNAYWYKSLLKWIIRKSELTLVTNAQLAEIVDDLGGTSIILPDPLPKAYLLSSQTDIVMDDAYVTFICTFAADEPLDEVLKAAECFPSLEFRITGNKSKYNSQKYRELPSNCRLTGFMPEADYMRCLSQSLAVIDLSLMPFCLVCGAYESIALDVPLIISEDIAARATFGKHIFYADNTAESLIEQIKCILANPDKARSQALASRIDFQRMWSKAFIVAKENIFGASEDKNRETEC